MTLSATAQRVSYSGDGSTTTFAFAFTIWAAAEMKVYLVSSAGVATLKTLTTHYTLSPSSYPATGNVVMVTAPAVGETLVLIRLQALSQALDLVNGDPMPSDLIERRFDILTGIIQNLSERLDRALTLPVQTSLSGIEYPIPTSAEDNYALLWDNATGDFKFGSILSTATVTVSAFGQTLIDDANAAAARTTLGAGTLNSSDILGTQTLWVPAAAMVARTTNGAAAGTAESATNKVMIKTLDFDASTVEYAQFAVQMPKSWNASTVTAMFVWSATNTGNVVWACQGLALSDDDAIDTAFGTAQSVTDGVTAAGDIMRSGTTSAITIGNSPAEQDYVVFQVYRDASNGSDTCAVDARLHGVAIFITTDALNDT